MKKAIAFLAVLALAALPALGRGGGDEWSDLVMPGVVGNVLGAVAGGLAGGKIDNSGESLISSGALLGVLAGSVMGSAVGVHLAAGRRGRLASALWGAILGEAAALGAVALIGDAGGLGLVAAVPLAVLPAAGAAAFYGNSLSSWQRRAGSGILKLSAGKFGFGVPEFQVSPMIVPGLKAKPGMRFNLRLLSVEL
jgi:hypothetical protein